MTNMMTSTKLKLTTLHNHELERIANSLERIANALEHINIENIEHNHVETDIPVEVNTHAKTW